MDLGLLCVHAHPDDEAILTGGVLARYAHEGIRTAVVTCTGGELGEIVGPEMDPEALRPRLADIRRDELAQALDILGAGVPRLLGFRDSGMFGMPSNDDARAFWKVRFDDAVRALVAEIRAFRPDVLVTYDAWGGYGHPDHIQTHRVAVVAAEAAAVGALYPDAGAAWRVRKVYFATIPKSVMLEWNEFLTHRGLPSPFDVDVPVEELPFGTDDNLITTVVDVRSWLTLKVAALRAHVSQLGPDSLFLNVPDDLQDAAFGREWFVRYHSDVPDGHADSGTEDDLFTGLRDDR